MCKECEKLYKRYHPHEWQHEIFPKAGTQFGLGWCHKETTKKKEGAIHDMQNKDR